MKTTQINENAMKTTQINNAHSTNMKSEYTSNYLHTGSNTGFK